MPQVADISVDLTDPGQTSRPRWGHSVAARYGWSTEYVHPTGGPYDYRASLQRNRWKLERTENGYIASDVLTGIFGFGNDATQAARDLAAALHEHRDVLERQDALSPPLQEQLDYLHDLL